MMYSASHHPKPAFIIGYTTRRHLLIDLDNTTLSKTISLSNLIMQQRPEVGDCLILLSSQGQHIQELKYTHRGRVLVTRSLDNYHLVFDNAIGYNKCCTILKTLAELNILNEDYSKIRTFRGDMTLRISPTVFSDRVKPIPTPKTIITNPYTNHRDGHIYTYLTMHFAMLNMFHNLNPSDTPSMCTQTQIR